VRRKPEADPEFLRDGRGDLLFDRLQISQTALEHPDHRYRPSRASSSCAMIFN
jgi:hypothetical protein